MRRMMRDAVAVLALTAGAAGAAGCEGQSGEPVNKPAGAPTIGPSGTAGNDSATDSAGGGYRDPQSVGATDSAAPAPANPADTSAAAGAGAGATPR